MIAPVVGFDLDMTLIDTRAGVAAAYQALSAQTGVYVDINLVVSRLGPPLREELANWFAPEQVEPAVQLYRQLYPQYAYAPSQLLPGAAAAVEAVRAYQGRVVVISSKHEPLVQAHLTYAGLGADAIVGDRYGPGKTAAIREVGAHIYLGDHLADVRAARSAGVVAAAVATGPYEAPVLGAAGADPVLTDLREFPGWFTGWLAQRAGGAAIAADAAGGSG